MNSTGLEREGPAAHLGDTHARLMFGTWRDVVWCLCRNNAYPVKAAAKYPHKFPV